MKAVCFLDIIHHMVKDQRVVTLQRSRRSPPIWLVDMLISINLRELIVGKFYVTFQNIT